MSLKEAAAVTAAQSLSKVFKQLESGGTNPADVRSANGAMDLAEVLGVTAADYARLLRQDEARP